MVIRESRVQSVKLVIAVCKESKAWKVNILFNWNKTTFQITIDFNFWSSKGQRGDIGIQGLDGLPGHIGRKGERGTPGNDGYGYKGNYIIIIVGNENDKNHLCYFFVVQLQVIKAIKDQSLKMGRMV